MIKHTDTYKRSTHRERAAWVAAASVAALLAAGAAQGATLHVDDDVFVNQNNPASNMDNFQFLQVRADGVGRDRRSLARFDLSALPAGLTGDEVAKATLRVYVRNSTTGGTVEVHRVTSGWSEETVTWNSQPNFAGLPEGSVAVGTAASNDGNEYVTVDITALVRDWVNGVLANNGVALVGDPLDNPVATFDAKHNQEEGHGPEIEVILVSNAETLCGSGELLDGDGNCVTTGPGGVTVVNAGTGLAGGGSGSVSLSLAANGVTANEVMNETLTAADLGPDSVGQSEIGTGAVASSEVQDNTLTGADILNESIGAEDLGSNSVGQSEIQTGGVASPEVMDNSLTSNDLGPDSVRASELASGSVVGGPGGDVLDGTITSADIASNTIVGADIQDGAVTSADIADDSLASTKLVNEAGLASSNASGAGTSVSLTVDPSWSSIRSVTLVVPAGGGQIHCICSGSVDIDTSSFTGQVSVGIDDDDNGTTDPPSFVVFDLPPGTVDVATNIPLTAQHTFTAAAGGAVTYACTGQVDSASAATDIDFDVNNLACMFFPTSY